jgi:hypothetical protein
MEVVRIITLRARQRVGAGDPWGKREGSLSPPWQGPGPVEIVVGLDEIAPERVEAVAHALEGFMSVGSSLIDVPVTRKEVFFNLR